jgi:hypothetical protein
MEQFTRFDTTTLGLVLLAGLVFHVALLALGKKWDTFGLLMGLFFVLAPLSAAIQVPGVEILKWARVYVALLMVAVAVVFYRSLQFGVASSWFLAFALYFFVAGVWSEAPVQAFLVKGVFLMVVMAGLLAGTNVNSLRQLRLIIRIGAVFSLVWILMVPLGLAIGRGDIIFGRLTAWGLNANRLGHELAAMLICTAWVAIYDQSKSWKLYGFATSGAIALIIVLTGSRASLAMAMIVAMVYGLPLIKKPGVLFGFGAGLTAIVAMALFFGKTEATGRLGEVNLETRQLVWDHGFEEWMRSPVIGNGWAADMTIREGGGSQNYHSIYLQALVEGGLVGIALLLVATLVACWKSAALLKRYFGSEYAPYVAFPGAAALACLAHGAAESGTIQGSNINSMLVVMGIALVDRVPALIAADEHERYEHELAELGEEHAHAGHAYDPALAASYGQDDSRGGAVAG